MNNTTIASRCVVADREQASSSVYVPCTLIMPDGYVARGKSVKAIRLMTAFQALAALRSNKAAWVAPADETTVLQELGHAGMV